MWHLICFVGGDLLTCCGDAAVDTVIWLLHHTGFPHLLHSPGIVCKLSGIWKVLEV